LKKNDPLPEPIITPTTKAGPGEHDERLTCDEVVERGFLDVETWDVVQAAALEIFRRGQEIARAVGFHLVDTKYEFGRSPDGTLMLIDEVHTPDSSRFWKANTYSEGEPEHWDKEYVRKWYATQGYWGDGMPPKLPEAEIAEAARRYIGLYEGITGRTFEPAKYPATARIKELIGSYATSVD
jgi:phosphoribosylaminoimidazole-succinocarboxamide synthase